MEWAFLLTTSAVCQKRNDSAVGQAVGPQWTRCRRFSTAFPIPIARWRNLPRVSATAATSLSASSTVRRGSSTKPVCTLLHCDPKSPISDLENKGMGFETAAALSRVSGSWPFTSLGGLLLWHAVARQFGRRKLLFSSLQFSHYGYPSFRGYEICPRWGSSANGASFCTVESPRLRADYAQSERATVAIQHAHRRLQRRASKKQMIVAQYVLPAGHAAGACICTGCGVRVWTTVSLKSSVRMRESPDIAMVRSKSPT